MFFSKKKKKDESVESKLENAITYFHKGDNYTRQHDFGGAEK